MPLRSVAALFVALAVPLLLPAAEPAAAGRNRFAGALFRQLAAQPGNIFLSPASLHSALALAATGANGPTAAQLAQALQVAPADLGKDAALFQAIAGEKSRAVSLTISNALWAQKGLSLRPAFARVAKGRFGAVAGEVDFLGQPEAARRTINAAVARDTRGHIAELIPQGGLDGAARLVLTNAIHFKGAWQSPFEKSETAPAAFTLASGERVHVPTMKHHAHFPFAKGSGFRALKLPYRGGSLALVVLLPNGARDLARLEKNLAAPLPAFAEREVEVSLPRFRLADDRDLSAPLRALGVTEAFSPRADFSGMLEGQSVALGGVVHKAVVEVNEAGTEAAAATGLLALAAAPPEEVVEFRVDRPFLFLIRHEESGAILFAGRVSDPRAQ